MYVTADYSKMLLTKICGFLMCLKIFPKIYNKIYLTVECMTYNSKSDPILLSPPPKCKVQLRLTFIVFVWSQLDGGKVEQKNNGISSRQNLMMP